VCPCVRGCDCSVSQYEDGGVGGGVGDERRGGGGKGERYTLHRDTQEQ